MTEVVRAEPGMRAEVEALLHGFRDNAFAPDEQWRKAVRALLDGAFHQRWDPEGFPGYVIRDGGKIQGYLATIFSRRVLPGFGEQRICNATLWFVKDAYRPVSLQLFSGVLALPRTTVLAYTTTVLPQVGALLGRLGFKSLDQGLTLVFAGSLLGAQPPLGVRVTTGLEAVGERLTGVERKILEDHRALPDCVHLLLEEGDQHCYLVSTRAPFTRFLRFHHVGNPALLIRHAKAVVAAAIREARGDEEVFYLGAVVEARLLGGAPLGVGVRTNFQETGILAPIYRPAPDGPDVGPALDNLYSELVLSST